MMYVNLHTLPAGQSMYTVYVTGDPVATPAGLVTTEEVDVVTSSRATVEQVVEAARAEIDDLYDSTVRVVGVANQSDGYVMANRLDGDLR